jgi:ABC-2 type transport system permease protein
MGNSIFRVDFFYGMIATLIFSCGIPLFQLFIYNKTDGYPGWSFNEILLFQAVLLLTLGINESLFGDIRPFMEYHVQQGVFDRLLLFPYSSIMMLITRGFSYKALGTLLAGIISTIVVIVRSQIVVSISHFFIFLIFLVIGILFRLSFSIIYCALTLQFIYFEQAKEVIDKFLAFGNFPAEIFSGVFHFVYLMVIPISVAVYFPVRSLLGHLDIFGVAGAVVSISIFILSIIFWNMQLKKYASAGG